MGNILLWLLNWQLILLVRRSNQVASYSWLYWLLLKLSSELLWRLWWGWHLKLFYILRRNIYFSKIRWREWIWIIEIRLHLLLVHIYLWLLLLHKGLLNNWLLNRELLIYWWIIYNRLLLLKSLLIWNKHLYIDRLLHSWIYWHIPLILIDYWIHAVAMLSLKSGINRRLFYDEKWRLHNIMSSIVNDLQAQSWGLSKFIKVCVDFIFWWHNILETFFQILVHFLALINIYLLGAKKV